MSSRARLPIRQRTGRPVRALRSLDLRSRGRGYRNRRRSSLARGSPRDIGVGRRETIRQNFRPVSLAWRFPIRLLRKAKMTFEIRNRVWLKARQPKKAATSAAGCRWLCTPIFAGRQSSSNSQRAARLPISFGRRLSSFFRRGKDGCCLLQPSGSKAQQRSPPRQLEC